MDEPRASYTNEVSQKEKNKYCILTHIYGIQKNGTDEPRRKQTCGYSTGRGRCDEQRKNHSHIYTTMCKIDSQWEVAI